MKNDIGRKVAITGIGMICPVGLNVKDSWDALRAGQSGIGRITRFDASDCLTRIAGELPDQYFDDERNVLPDNVLKEHSFPTRLAMMTTHQALDDAGFSSRMIEHLRVGCITGSGGVSVGNLTGNSGGLFGDSPYNHDMIHTLPANISGMFGFTGPSYNIATACASGAYAVGMSFDYVKTHGLPCVAIGVDTMVLKDSIDGFNKLMALSESNDNPEKASCPFDKKRTGFVMSEGASALVMEPMESAIKRGARIYASVIGKAFTCEAYNIMAPIASGEGISSTMQLAIEDAGIRCGDIGYINAHGTSTQHNDLAETNGIKHLFKERAYDIPVSSVKSMIGHSIGASGAIEAAVTAMTLYHQVLIPTINQQSPDPECDLDYVPNLSRDVTGLNYALTNSFGFGGHNSSIVFERYCE